MRSTVRFAYRSSWMRVSSCSILNRIVFLPADQLLVGIDPDVEVVVEQVVVGAVPAVFAAQDARARGRRLGGRPAVSGSVRRRTGRAPPSRHQHRTCATHRQQHARRRAIPDCRGPVARQNDNVSRMSPTPCCAPRQDRPEHHVPPVPHPPGRGRCPGIDRRVHLDSVGHCPWRPRRSRYKVRVARIEDVLGDHGSSNVHGETQQKLDVIANDILMTCLGSRPSLAVVASEEDDEPTLLRKGVDGGKYCVIFDPLDGSSNLDVGVGVGTIFSDSAQRPGDSRRRRDAVPAWLETGGRRVRAVRIVHGLRADDRAAAWTCSSSIRQSDRSCS